MWWTHHGCCRCQGDLWLQPATDILACVADAAVIATTLLSIVTVARTLCLAQEQVLAAVLGWVALALNVRENDTSEKEVHPHCSPHLV